MQKITFKVLAMLALTLSGFVANAQFGCGSGVVLTNGYTASGITTPGNGGSEDWNTNPTDSSINALYFDDDVYLFQYTAGATGEFISMTTFSRNSWNGLGIFTTCTGTSFSGELDAVGSTGNNATKTVEAVLSPGQTVYIAVGQWGTPDALDFDVVSFTAVQVTAPSCTTFTSPTNNSVNVSSEGIFTWTSVSMAAGYNLSIGTTPGGTDVLNLVDVGNVTTYNVPGILAPNTIHYATLIPYNGSGSATGCTEIMFTTDSPPANDNCSGALMLTVNPDLACTAVTAGSTLLATQSMAAAPCAGTPNDDVWFKFVATSSAHTVTISDVVAVVGTGTDMYFQVLSGSCTDLISVICSDPNSTSFGGLTIGNTYSIRVYSYTATSRQNFNICVSTPPAPPANDECAGAVTLIVNPTLACDNVTQGTTISGTQSMAASPCSGTPNDDVWFKFVATAPSHQVTLSNIVATSGTSTDMYFQVLSGACGTLTSVLCSDPNTNEAVGLTIGDTYYVRVYSYGTTVRFTFDICIGTPPPPPPTPANDECAGAITLTVNPDFSCAAITSSSTAGATQSMAATPCFGTPNDDVWFKFVATGTEHSVSLTNRVAFSGTSTDLYFQVMSGTCGDTASIICSDPESNNVVGLTPGETYLIRVYTYYATSRVNFDICIGTQPAAPANDDCSGAIALTVNPDTTCTSVTAATTAGATQSMPAAPCGGNPNDDVWFSFVATSEAHTVALSNLVAVVGTSTDMYFQVLSGTCGATNSILCSDPNTNTVGSLVIGDTYFVRVYSYAVSSRQNFDICISTPPAPPANDNCAGAITVTVNATLSCDAVTAGSTLSATQSMVASPCSGTANDDVWFKFVAIAPQHVITLSNIVAVSGTSLDAFFQVLSGDCTNTQTSMLCSDANSNTVTGLTVGDTYFVRVYTYGTTSRISFDVCIASDPQLGTANFNSDKFNYYPNPVKDQLKVSHSSLISSVAVFNMIGQQVLKVQANSTEVSVDMSSLPAGSYVVKATADDAADTFKVIKI